MPDVQEAAPSAAPAVETPSLEVPRSGPEYDTWRKTGALPEKKSQPTNAAPATADPSKETHSAPEGAEPAPESESGEPTQEIKRKRTAEARIDQMTARMRQLERELEEARRSQTRKDPAESSTATAKPQPPQSYADYRKNFKPTEWQAQYMAQNPDAPWEDVQAAMVDHLADARDYFRNIEQQKRAVLQTVEEKANAARAVYGEKFDEVRVNFLSQITDEQGNALNGFPQNMLEIMSQSPNMAHLVYVIGEDPQAAAEFVHMAKTDRYKAYRYLARVEDQIEANLAGRSDSATRNERGQFTKNEQAPPPPAKRGPESAPEPPIEIGSRGSGPVDESERALKNVERGSSKDFRAWKEAEDRKELARRRGA